MKKSTSCIIAGLAGIVLTGSVQAAVITHYDIDFDDYASGPLPLSGTAWTGRNVVTNVTGTGDKYLDLSSSFVGEKWLRLTATDNANTGTTSLRAGAGMSYQWSFSFRLPTAVSPILLRLDSGNTNAGQFLSGLTIDAAGDLWYMTNPNTGTLSLQMTKVSAAEFQLAADTWYHVTFDMVTGEWNDENGLPIESGFSITGNGSSFSATSSYVSDNLLASELRMMWGPRSASNPMHIHMDNLRLTSAAAIPEPGAVSLMVGTGVLGLFASRRRLFARK